MLDFSVEPNIDETSLASLVLFKRPSLMHDFHAVKKPYIAFFFIGCDLMLLRYGVNGTECLSLGVAWARNAFVR